MNLILLAGGKGERLWPISTADVPKQFLKINSSYSFFQKTILRCSKLFDKTFVLSQEKYFFSLLDQLKEISMQSSLILEPFGKGTLPVLTLSLFNLKPDEFFFMTPTDLEIEPKEKFQEFLIKLINNAKKESVYLIGKKPTYAHTGYGYIIKDENSVKFIEKPIAAIAKELILQKDVLWNCGMIFANVRTFLNLIKQYQPVLFENCEKLIKNSSHIQLFHSVLRFNPEKFLQLPSLSIDHGVLEKAQNLCPVAADFEWKDCGTFTSLIDDTKENLKLLNSSNIRTQGIKKQLIVQNMQDVAIIENEKQIFIIKK